MGPTWWAPADGGITVTVRVAPGARRSEVVEVGADRLRLRIAAPPVEGKANAELQRFVAEVFGVRRSAVAIVRGERGRDKALLIAGIDQPPPWPQDPAPAGRADRAGAGGRPRRRGRRGPC